jgi:hypothetical protein
VWPAHRVEPIDDGTVEPYPDAAIWLSLRLKADVAQGMVEAMASNAAGEMAIRTMSRTWGGATPPRQKAKKAPRE